MTDPLVKNPDRVPGILQGFDATSSTGGVGVTITKSMINPETIQVTETEPFMSDTKDVITEDGIYTDAAGNSFQYRKGHQLPEGAKKDLKKVGEFPEPEAPGAAEHEATKADTQPENRKEADPSNKQRG